MLLSSNNLSRWNLTILHVRRSTHITTHLLRYASIHGSHSLLLLLLLYKSHLLVLAKCSHSCLLLLFLKTQSLLAFTFLLNKKKVIWIK
uniref:Candidate secreted effector n=1 Tax=Meloidogyne incognita TaxID=6306 RepID=A0A914M7M3_MELIC